MILLSADSLRMDQALSLRPTVRGRRMELPDERATFPIAVLLIAELSASIDQYLGLGQQRRLRAREGVRPCEE